MTTPVRPVIAVAWPKPDYVNALQRAGADVRELAPSDALPLALESCDGLLLTGGADVNPAHYGEARHPTVEIDAARDDYEFTLTRAALAGDLPLLGICRGVQVLNVAAGGSLVQDIPTALTTSIDHRVREPKNAIAHGVTVAAGTQLSHLLGGSASSGTPVDVNSRHHQSVKDVAAGFVVSAVAPDGVIEAIERSAATFCVGVQWHPENFWATGEFSALFAGFVRAASERASRRRSRVAIE